MKHFSQEHAHSYGIDADAIKGSRMVADSVRSKANDILTSLI